MTVCAYCKQDAIPDGTGHCPNCAAPLEGYDRSFAEEVAEAVWNTPLSFDGWVGEWRRMQHELEVNCEVSHDPILSRADTVDPDPCGLGIASAS